MTTRSVDALPDSVGQPPPDSKVGRELHAKRVCNSVEVGCPCRRVQGRTEAGCRLRQPVLDPVPCPLHGSVGTHAGIKTRPIRTAASWIGVTDRARHGR